MWLQAVLWKGLETAISIPLTIGLEPSMNIARAMGRSFATSRINRKRFPRAINNIRDAFPEWSEDQVHEIAVNSYEHFFQLAVEFAHAPRFITHDGFSRHLHFTEISPALRALLARDPVILISGHCGNWELIGYSIAMLGFPMHAVYRPLDNRPADAWVRETRSRRGLTMHSKFGAVKSLPPVLAAGQPVGLVADQSGGDRGVFAPFFGRLTSTYKSIGLLAINNNVRVVCGVARRLRPDETVPNWPAAATIGPKSLRYSVELIDTFGPEDWSSHPDPLFYLTARYRRAMEVMVRRAPEQYLWMHRIWRSRPGHERHGKPFPPQLREKLASLPWMTDADVERIVERSRLDVAAAAKA